MASIRCRRLLLGMALPLAAFQSLVLTTAGQAHPRVRTDVVPVAVSDRWAAGDWLSEDDDDRPRADPRVASRPLTAEEAAQRCGTGRLVGGLAGGALGYRLSRQDGRAWAIPLGALLGSQMGCSAAVGRGPRPW